MPRVVLIGRTNVGKSCIFNRLAVDARSIAFDLAGVTRDVIKDVVSWKGYTFELVDTGGISLRKSTDPILLKVRQQALNMIEESEVVLLVVDGSVGLQAEDREVADAARKHGKKVIVVVNKSDSPATAEQQYEFERLGFKQMVSVSAIHGRGFADLLELICQALPHQGGQAEVEPTYRVVFLGKPNVGKSSLMNLLVQQERSIVNDQPGTTREPISEMVSFYKEDIVLTDTAGIRRKRSIKDPLESVMVSTSFKALDAADIVLLLVDAHEGTISDQEWKLAFYAFEQKKALIILYNKQDLVDEDIKKEMEFNTELYEHFLKKIPSLHISCKTGKNVGKILPLVKEVWARYSQKLSDQDLTVVCKEALLKAPLYHKTHLLKLYKVEQVSTAPITLLLHVNEPVWFEETQLGFFDNILRKEYDLKGVPIKFLLKKRK